MLDRRTMAAMLAAAPFAKSLSRLDVPDPGLHPLRTEGAAIFGISPDASVLVGHVDSDRLAFLDATSLAVISETESTDWMQLLDDRSVAWSPDGTKMAFSLRAWAATMDSDIFVVDSATGALTNITPEDTGTIADSFMNATDLWVDTSPIWLDDDTLLFARHSVPNGEERQCELIKVSISSGATELFLDLEPHGLWQVDSKIWRLSGGDLVFLAASTDFQVGREAVRISPDGDLSRIHLDALDTFVIDSVNDTHMIAMEVAQYEWWYVPLDTEEEPVPIWEKFELPNGWTRASIPILGPEPETVFIILKSEQGVYAPHLFVDGGIRQLAHLPGADDTAALFPRWADEWILVTGKDDSWLVPEAGVTN